MNADYFIRQEDALKFAAEKIAKQCYVHGPMLQWFRGYWRVRWRGFYETRPAGLGIWRKTYHE